MGLNKDNKMKPNKTLMAINFLELPDKKVETIKNEQTKLSVEDVKKRLKNLQIK